MNLSDSIGITQGIPFDAYLELPGLSASRLKKAMESPLAFKWSQDHPNHASSPAMALGTAAHTAILEPHRMATDYVVWDGGDRRGKPWTEFKEANATRSILTAGEYADVQGMAASLRGFAPAAKYLKEGVAEVTIEWVDPDSGKKFHGRVDWVTEIDGEIVLVDLKTTRDSSFRKFCADAYRLGYHIQFALYCDGWFYLTGRTPRFVVLAVESKAPYEPAVFNVPDDVLMQGHEEYSALLETIQSCESANYWPPRAVAEQELALPSWAFSSDDDDLTDLNLDLSA